MHPHRREFLVGISTSVLSVKPAFCGIFHRADAQIPGKYPAKDIIRVFLLGKRDQKQENRKKVPSRKHNKSIFAWEKGSKAGKQKESTQPKT